MKFRSYIGALCTALFLLTVCLLTGCSNDNSSADLSSPDQSAGMPANTSESTTTNGQSMTVSAAADSGTVAAASPEGGTSAGTEQNSAAPSPAEKIITAEEAKTAALKHAGLDASEVTFTKAELDYDDGVREYEIEFNTAAEEYEYDINAETGMVIKYSKEVLDMPAMNAAQSTVTLDEAKAAALEYAGLDASEVKFTKAELDYDDGVPEYEIEFRHSGKEYEFKIDAYSGEILEAEID